MRVEVHILCFSEADIIGYSIRHYLTYADRIFVHDARSTDDSRKIARSFGEKVVVLDWETDGKMSDIVNANLKNNCWKGTRADWVIVADADELIYFPEGPSSLLIYDAYQVPIVKPSGWELFSKKFPTTKVQIYDEVKTGARDDKWYSKPILFSPKRVKELGAGMGAHECCATLMDGSSLIIDGNTPKTDPPALLLHCKHLGPLSRMAKQYDGKILRHSAENIKNGWGNFRGGKCHAQEKRDGILARLERLPL